MAAMSDYLRQQLVNHIFRNTAYNQPTTLALALCISAVVDSDTGNLTGKEVTGSGYARVNVGRGNSIWADGTLTYNLSPIVWPTATGNWTGPITYLAIIDDPTIGVGNLLWYGALTQQKTITTGDIFVLNASDLSVVPG
jgi:hypothetical protein